MLFKTVCIISALMAEFPKSEMPCMTDTTAMYPDSKEGYSIILGLRSSVFIETIADHLKHGYGVIAISTQNDNLMASYSVLENILKTNTKFVLINSASRCNTNSIGMVFEKYLIEKVTIMYDTADFVPYISASDTSASVSCLIDLLEVISNHNEGKYKKIPINVHHSYTKVPQFIPYFQVSPKTPDPYFVLKETKSAKQCKAEFDYNQYYDVFLKSVEIYATTYKRLYNLDVKRIIS